MDTYINFHRFLFYFDFSSAESMKTSDFSTEMDELFLWIDETENVLASYVTLDEKSLDETLEKIKVWKFVYNGVCIYTYNLNWAWMPHVQWCWFDLNILLIHYVWEVGGVERFCMGKEGGNS